MDQKNPIYALIDRWKSRADMAADLSEIVGAPVSVDRVHKWAQTGAIPSNMQRHVVVAARRRGIDLTPMQMLELHAIPSAGAA